MGGQGPQGPGQGQPATDTTKPNQDTRKKKAQKTHPDNQTKKGGAQPRSGPSTHAHTAHPSQERRGTSEAHAQTRTLPQHPQPGGAGDHAGRAHEHTHAPTPPQGQAGRSRNPNPSTHAHTAHRNRKRRGAGGARTQPHTSQKQAETQAQPRTTRTAGKRGTTPQAVPKHTRPRPQPGLAGLTKPTPNRNPDPNTNAAQQ